MSSIPREALKTSASKPGVIGNVGRRDLVHHFGGGVAQHPLGSDIEDLDDALGVGGDGGEVGAVEDRALQRAGLQQYIFGLFRHCVFSVLEDANTRRRPVVSKGQGVLPITRAWPAWRTNYADSKLRCEQRFNGILELKSGVRLLQKVRAGNEH
jgi:hypothetical protein